MTKEPVFVIAMIDIEDKDEADFQRWLDEEHLPTKLSVPGIFSIRRFRVADGPENSYSRDRAGSKFVILYEVESVEALEAPSNRDSSTGGKDQTEWSKKVHKNFTEVRRDLYREIRHAAVSA